MTSTVQKKKDSGVEQLEIKVCRECGRMKDSGATWKSKMKDSLWICDNCYGNTPSQTRKTWKELIHAKLLIVRKTIEKVKRKMIRRD